MPLSSLGLCVACDGSWLRVLTALAWSSPLTQSPFPVTSHIKHSKSDVCLFVLRWSLAPSPSTSLSPLPLSLYINTLTPGSSLLPSSHYNSSTTLLLPQTKPTNHPNTQNVCPQRQQPQRRHRRPGRQLCQERRQLRLRDHPGTVR